MRKPASLAAVITFGIAGMLAAPGPAVAAQGTGCPNGFELQPVSILGTNFSGIADNVNHDGLICIKATDGGPTIFIDNTAP